MSEPVAAPGEPVATLRSYDPGTIAFHWVTAVLVLVLFASMRIRPLLPRDWHLGGPLGRALLGRMLDEGWLRRRPNDRAVDVTAAGRRGLREAFGLDLDSDGVQADVEHAGAGQVLRQHVGKAGELERRIVAEEVIGRGVNAMAEIDILKPWFEGGHALAQVVLSGDDFGDRLAAHGHVSFKLRTFAPQEPTARRLTEAGSMSKRWM